MRDIMFEIPSNPNIEKCIITKETVKNGEAPRLVINNNREVTKKEKAKRESTKKTESAQKTEIISLFLNEKIEDRLYNLLEVCL